MASICIGGCKAGGAATPRVAGNQGVWSEGGQSGVQYWWKLVLVEAAVKPL
jgi:hypothetical protein